MDLILIANPFLEDFFLLHVELFSPLLLFRLRRLILE